jgi:hypothetical protein
MTMRDICAAAVQRGERWHSAALQRRMLAWGGSPYDARLSAWTNGSVG